MTTPRTTEPARDRGELFSPRFELFTDVLALGLLVAVTSLPLVTAPAALSTACGLLRRRQLHAEPAGAGRYLTALGARLRSAPGRELAAGGTLLAAVLLLAADALLANAGLPGARAFAAALAAVTTAATVIALRACATPGPVRPGAPYPWRDALRSAALRSVSDPPGSGLVLLALATAAVCGWMLLPLLFLVPGPLALALTAVELRLPALERH